MPCNICHAKDATTSAMKMKYSGANRLRNHPDPMLRLIAAFRLLKAALLIAAGIELLRPLHIPEWIAQFPRVMVLVWKLDDPHRKHFLAATAFAYAALFIAEGTGLWLQNKWAEYLTLIATASFLPFEIYEVVKRVTALRVVVIVINAAIVV
jgi:uncharacterized membrane protein (DUF2068 family)